MVAAVSREGPAAGRSAILWLWAAALTALASSVGLLLWFLPDALPLSHTSGVWATLAQDLSEGVLYRPVFADQGYGATRYVPLFFALHALLIRLFGDPVVTAFSLSLLSLLLLDLAGFAVLRMLGVRAGVAAAFALLLHASTSLQVQMMETSGDFLAAAFNGWGIYFFLRHERAIVPPRQPTSAGVGPTLLLILAGLSFVLAAMTKVTAVGGLLAFAVYCFVQGKRGHALRCLLGVGSGIALALVLVIVASQGRIIEAFREAATGGISPWHAARFPLWFARVAIRDPFFLLTLLFALFLALHDKTPWRGSLVRIYLAVQLAITMAIFTSPGTDRNHLIDLMVAGLWVIAVRFSAGGATARRIQGFCIAMTVLTAAMWIPGVPSVRYFIEPLGRPTRTSVEQIRHRLRDPHAVLLSENPLLPTLLGQRAFVLDCFTLRLLAAHHPEIGRDFARRMEQKFFGAVILMDWSGMPLERIEAAIADRHSLGVKSFYGEVHFAPGFLDLLRRNYRLSFMVKPFVVFEPLP